MSQNNRYALKNEAGEYITKKSINTDFELTNNINFAYVGTKEEMGKIKNHLGDESLAVVNLNKMIVCERCLRAIESRGENVSQKQAEIDEDTAVCEWCGEEFESSELYEI